MEIHISLGIVWAFLIVFFSAMALSIWLWFIPYGIMEYNLGINLFSGSFFMVLTVVFFNVVLTVREKSEWKKVQVHVYLTIQSQLHILFNQILSYVEKGSAVKTSLENIQDKKTRNENGLSELRKLKDAKELKLGSVELACLLENKSELENLLEISKDLSEVEIKYSRFLPPRLYLSLMRIRDALTGIETLVRFHRSFKNLSPILSTLTPKQIQEMGDDPRKLVSTFIPTTVSLCFKKILEEIYNMHEMGIEFSPYTFPLLANTSSDSC